MPYECIAGRTTPWVLKIHEGVRQNRVGYDGPNGLHTELNEKKYQPSRVIHTWYVYSGMQRVHADCFLEACVMYIMCPSEPFYSADAARIIRTNRHLYFASFPPCIRPSSTGVASQHLVPV